MPNGIKTHVKIDTRREYIIFDDRPAYPVGGHRVNAYPTFGKPWSVIREWLPPTVCNYSRVFSANRRAAIAKARRLYIGTQ